MLDMQATKGNTALWMFTGQGSPTAGSAGRLYREHITFRVALNQYAEILQDHLDIPILELLIGEKGTHAALAQETQYAQPALTALQCAQIALWQKQGARPSLVMGHSIGEIAAAVAAGVLTPEDALNMAVNRGQLMSQCQTGAMAAVFASAVQIEHLLSDDLVIAAENGPLMTVVAGSHEAVKHFLEKKLGTSYASTLLPVSHAFHSPLMSEAAKAFEAYVSKVSFSLPHSEVRFVSTLTGVCETEQLLSPSYWSEQILQPVKFLQAFKTALALDPKLEQIIELGPEATLINMAKRISPADGRDWIATAKAMFKSSSLFRYSPLAWNKPSAKLIIKKEQNSELENCLFEPTWQAVATPAGPSEDALTLRTDSTVVLTYAKSTQALPWPLVDASDQTALDESLSNLREKASPRASDGALTSPRASTASREVSNLNQTSWQRVIVLGSDHPKDLALGLQVLKAVQRHRIPEVIFVTARSSWRNAGLWGLARSFRLEEPQIKVICLEISQAESAHADQILVSSLAAIRPYRQEDEFQLSEDGDLSVRRLMRMPLQKTTELKVHSNASYVISGGQGALGHIIAQSLIARGAKYLILLSRRPRETLELAELRKQARVEVLRCDVAVASDVRTVQSWILQEKWPAIAGIVHAAGVLTDATIPKQTAEMLEAALGAKVHGALHLQSILAPKDFLVLFSSAAGILGSPGQASYAAANASLDALASTWVDSAAQVLVLQWGAWAEVGMASLGAARRGAQTGFGTISNSLGREVFEKLLAMKKQGCVCVVPFDWKRLQWNTPLLTAIRPITQTSPSRSSHSSSLAILETLRQIVEETAGQSLADDVPVLDNGLDSLGSVSLRNRIVAQFKVELSAAFIFDYPTINAMAKYLSSITVSIAPEALAEAAVSSLPVLVLGAGIGGLSFARQLEKAGTPVIVMEAAAQAGGVWRTLANTSSKLQIDSPAYDFDSTAMPVADDHRWGVSFPGQEAILQGCAATADSLKGPVHFNTRVTKVESAQNGEYRVTYQQAGVENTMRVGGVAAMTGGLHHPVRHIFPGEQQFTGHIGLGVANDVPLTLYKGANVVIVGHGAFAIENMRTALENGATHVTILCRKRQMVFSTFCNWLLNASKGVMPVSDVVEIMRPFYQACGIKMEELESLVKDKNGDWLLDQTTVPAGSDLYFLAQILGKLRVRVGEIAEFTPDAVLTQAGENIPADIVLKCFGSDTDSRILPSIFGENVTVEGLWINGDPNLFTYNDGAQVPRKVKSLMCSSYAFFVQSFAPAYLRFRKHPQDFTRALSRINNEDSPNSYTERILIELWDDIEPAKRTVAERTMELCPFDRFQVEREREWQHYISLLTAKSSLPGRELWSFLHPTLSIHQRRNPSLPAEKRSHHPLLGSLSVFVPKRRRVLFLPGQGTNGRLARTLLDRTGWLERSHLDFVIPDAPYEMPAFTNEEQLRQIGLDGLVGIGLYDKTAIYREWRAGFEALFEAHHFGKPIPVSESLRLQWEFTLGYVREVLRQHGPFDGIAGFCEGSAVASVALHRQQQGYDLGLDKMQFFIAMSPWRSPLHDKEGLFNSGTKLSIPTLQIMGKNDMEVFLAAGPQFAQDFANLIEFQHGGQHVYPSFTPGLGSKLRELLSMSDISALF